LLQRGGAAVLAARAATAAPEHHEHERAAEQHAAARRDRELRYDHAHHAPVHRVRRERGVGERLRAVEDEDHHEVEQDRCALQQ